MTLIVDFETRSACDLSDCGAHVYAAHPSTEIILLAYQIDSIGPMVWTPGDAAPQGLLNALRSGRQVWAWNSAFDRQIWERCTPTDWYRPAPEQWNDAMAVAAYRCLPMGLGDCAAVLGVSETKADTGKALIQKYCKPISKRNPAFREMTPEDAAAMAEYALQDVRTTRAVLDRIGKLPADERKWWLLEQKINDRGVAVNLPAVTRAIEMMEQEKARIDTAMAEATGGQITTATQAERITAFVNHFEPNRLPDCTKEAVAEALETVTTPAARRVLELRREGSLAATKKLYRMVSGADADGRARGLMQYHGATTGREAGRRIQPQNMFRPDDGFDEYGLTPDLLTSFPSAADANAYITAVYGSPVRAIANMTRNFLRAAPGHLFVAADYSAVEARVNACLAGEETKVQAFRDVDAGLAEDIYCVTASKVYRRPITKKENPKERQGGKIVELACGFGGSVGALQRFGADKLGWDEEEMITMVRAWRAAHPRIHASWHGYEEAAALAVQRPGTTTSYGPISFCVWKDWLLCRLPSGRTLHYFKPRPDTGKFGGETFGFWANKQTLGGGRAWRYCQAYGGLLCENIVQACSRDLLVHAVFSCEELALSCCLTVHDEILCEVPADRADPSLLKRAMERVPSWAEGWPIKAEVWEGPYYQK